MAQLFRRALLVLGIGSAVLATGLAAYWYLKGGNEEIRSGAVVSGGGSAIGGPFSMLDQNGQRRTEQDFAGKYLLVYFGFTYCVDACPLALLNMTQAMDRLDPAKADKVQPLFFSVDPARDTPEQLRTYLENFYPTFVGLTGSDSEVAAAAKAYRVPYDAPKPDANGDYQVAHSTIIYLMGPDGAFIRHFDHMTSAGDIAQALDALVP